jgi:hypothetical protein
MGKFASLAEIPKDARKVAAATSKRETSLSILRFMEPNWKQADLSYSLQLLAPEQLSRSSRVYRLATSRDCGDRTIQTALKVTAEMEPVVGKIDDIRALINSLRECREAEAVGLRADVMWRPDDVYRVSDVANCKVVNLFQASSVSGDVSDLRFLFAGYGADSWKSIRLGSVCR